MARLRWFTRAGRPISQAKVEAAKQNYARAKETGSMGTLRCTVDVLVAERIRGMTLVEFANWSGRYTYRRVER